MMDPSLPVNPPLDPVPNRHVEVDGCPSCVTNVEPPQNSYQFRDRVIAFYRCTDCGHRWHTSWRTV